MRTRQRGKTVERAAVRLLRSLGYTAHRTAQASGKMIGDIIVEELPDLSVEVKGVTQMEIGGALLGAALRRAEQDATMRRLKRAVVLWRGKYERQWKMTWRDEAGVTITVGGRTDIGRLLASWRNAGRHDGEQLP
jgi:hypothetical protein